MTQPKPQITLIQGWATAYPHIFLGHEENPRQWDAREAHVLVSCSLFYAANCYLARHPPAQPAVYDLRGAVNWPAELLASVMPTKVKLGSLTALTDAIGAHLNFKTC